MAKKNAVPNPESVPVAPLRSGIAEKASGSKIFYEIGRTPGTENLFLRLVGNEGGGTFSKEWVPFERLFGIVRDVGKTGKPFAPGPVVQTAYTGRSRNNGPFLAYALRGEGLLAVAGEKGNLTTVAGDWTAWAKKALALPVPKIEEAPSGKEPKAKKSKTSRAKSSKAEEKQETVRDDNASEEGGDIEPDDAETGVGEG